MDKRRHPNESARTPEALDRTIASDAAASDDWLSGADPRPPEVVFAAAERGGRQSARHAASAARRLAPLGGLVAAVCVITALVILTPGGTPRAAAEPRQAAKAAERAQTFAFVTTTRLEQHAQLVRVSTALGAVDLADGGAFRVRVTSGDGVGFERVVLHKAIYTRPIGVRGSGRWLGARLVPPAAITAHGLSGRGISDELGLLGALARTHASYKATETGDGERRFQLTLTVGQLLDGSLAIATRVAATPVDVTVVQNRHQEITSAVRQFHLGGRNGQTLTVTTRFARYGLPVGVEPPQNVPLIGHQKLNPAAGDPLGTSVLKTLAGGQGHSTTPALTASQASRAAHLLTRPLVSSGLQPLAASGAISDTANADGS